MGKITGFLEYSKVLPAKRAVEERIKDYKEIDGHYSPGQASEQAARCMDCGVPFCHNGCPLGNLIPDFNDAVYNGRWQEAYRLLSATNNFPEFTGRICPAPCESACVLGINADAVAIEQLEKSIIERAFVEGWVKASPPIKRTGKKVAVIGSGPAGLAAAVQLNKAGHLVTVFEKAPKAGGLLRYGIPDFKLDKWVIDRRISIMEEEGIQFITNCEVGVDYSTKKLQADFDAILLCGGATKPRDLPIPGRDLEGVHFAMDFLTQQNKLVSGLPVTEKPIKAGNKEVIVIGGGDTGADCVGTSHRQKAKRVQQLELLPQPPALRPDHTPWPLWPMMLRTSSSHEEGGERHWSVLTKAFIGDKNGRLKGLQVVDIEWYPAEGGKPSGFREIAGSARELPCQLALLALGFLHAPAEGLLRELGVALDVRGLVDCNNYQTSVTNVFSAGDIRRGQSLVVWAIQEGRQAACALDEYLCPVNV
jgi:glutamate synthase (NADPH) small chain